MLPLTLFLAKFLGVSCSLMCACLLLRAKEMLQTIDALVNNAALMLVTGILTMGGGVALVLGHNVWTGGALPVAVTVLGWLTLLKGVALMAVPPRTLAAFYGALHYADWFRPYMAVTLLFSLWLAVAGFLA